MWTNVRVRTSAERAPFASTRPDRTTVSAPTGRWANPTRAPSASPCCGAASTMTVPATPPAEPGIARVPNPTLDPIADVIFLYNS